LAELPVILFLLLASHCLADFVLQNETMVSGKNRHSKRHEESGGHFPPWYYWLGAHALIHGALVYLVTYNLYFGLAETALHASIDFLKCERKINFHLDQVLHVLCKIAYVIYL